MQNLHWNKTLETGVEEFDKMYPVVLENVQLQLRMLTASRTTTDYRKNLEDIKAQFIELFTYQENMMFNQKYNQYYQHKHDHEKFIEELDGLYGQISGDYFGSTAAQVENVITNWLMRHIFMYDKLWGKYTTEHK